MCTCMILWHLCELHTYITHLQHVKMRDEKKNGLALKWRCCCCFGLPIKQNGDPNIWDHGWRMDLFQGWKQVATTEALCTYGSLSCGQKHNLCIVHQHIQPSLFIWCRHSIFCFPEELCEEFLYLSLALFRYVCMSPSFSSSLLSSCLCPSCPISLLLLQVFSLSLLSIHPYVVGFATFIENH